MRPSPSPRRPARRSLAELRPHVRDGRYRLGPHVTRHALAEGFTEQDVVMTLLHGRELARYLEDHPELAGETVDLDDFFAQRLLVQERVEDELAPLAAAFEAQRAARAGQAAWLRLASPALLAMDGLADAAGTGEPRHRHFMDQVHGFHEQWHAFFAPRVLSGERFFDHEGVPGFIYEKEPLSRLLPRSMLLLASTSVFVLILGWLALRRCRSLPKVIGNG